ncbi:MAG TPA: hypothetical protein VF516_22875 [Kofleriaceae bacterium]
MSVSRDLHSHPDLSRDAWHGTVIALFQPAEETSEFHVVEVEPTFGEHQCATVFAPLHASPSEIEAARPPRAVFDPYPMTQRKA